MLGKIYMLEGKSLDEKQGYSRVELDIEWLLLIREAKKIGIKKEDIRKFLLTDKEVLAEGR